MSASPEGNLDPQAVEHLASRLQEYASELSPREQAVLLAMIRLTMPPLEQMRRRTEEEVLNDHEREILLRVRGDGR